MLRAVAIALGVLLVATGATAAAGDYVVVATNQRVRRPTAGLVHAEMVDELPTATELAADAEVNAHALDSANGIVTSHSVDSAELHPLRNGVATTLFASAPILSAEQQAEADARAQEPGLFTPDALEGAQAVAHSAYVEVEEGVQLLTETERLAMMETAAHAASGARTGSGPRKYLVHAGMNNGGSVLARFEQQTAATCQERCEGDAQCVGFSVVRNPQKRKGLCTLRSTWGSNLDNPDFDSYQAHDYSLAPMPFQDIEAHVKTAIPGQQLLVLADFARVKPARNQKTAELLVSVDHNQPDAVWTNVPSNYRDANSFRAPSVAGVTNPLKSAGDHTVRIDYSRAFEAPAQVDDRSGCQQQRLTAIPFPIELSATRVYDVVGQHWNLAPASSITAKNFVAIPGGVPEADVEGDGGASGAADAGSMSIKLAVPEDGARVLVFADISRVQHSHGWTNSVFRITVDNQEIAFTNTGEHYGFQYRAIALRGASGSLKKGEHTIAVQAKTQRGKLFFISDGNGYQQRRLTALVVPKGNLWNRKWNLSTAWLKPSKWAELPGAPMRLTLTTEQMGQLLVTVGISRVQSWGNGNVELRLLLSGEKDDIAEGEGYEIARTNTGNVNGWRYQDVSFHAVTPLLAPGTHSVRVQVRSKSGQTVVFYNDGNGLQQRRLSAVLIPPSAGLKSVTQSGVTCTPKLPPSPLPPTPAPAKPATPAAPAAPGATKPAATATPAAPAPAPTPAPATPAPTAAASSAAAAAPAVKSAY